VAAYPTVVEQGIIWVYPTPISALNYAFPDRSTIPLCEPLLDPGVVCLDVSRDLPYSYETRALRFASLMERVAPKPQHPCSNHASPQHTTSHHKQSSKTSWTRLMFRTPTTALSVAGGMPRRCH
jgi:hypothetical protein